MSESYQISAMNKVTVIVPNYNHEPFLKLRLESILNQTYTNFEIILLDDHSSDNSRSIIEQYRDNPRVRSIIYNDTNSGSTFHQWTKGILLAETEYIWIAESDDYASPRFLETMLALTEKYPDVGIAYSNSYKVDAAGNILEDLNCYMDAEFEFGRNEVKRHMCLYNTITNVSSCLLKREYAINALTGLGTFKTCGDWIFYARMLQHCNLAYSHTKLNYYRWHHTSVSFSASQTSAYVSEGIHVIRDIDYKLVRFTLREYLTLCKGWLKKIVTISPASELKAIWILTFTTYKYCTAKISLTVAG